MMVAEEADAAAGGGGSKKKKPSATQISRSQQPQQQQQQQPYPSSSSLSKRALLKQPNVKNVWPQHPKIHDPERRAQAYLRVAGLVAREGVETAAGNGAVGVGVEFKGPELKFGRLLGGADPRVRHGAVRQLRHYLKSKCAIISVDEDAVGDDEDNNNNGNEDRASSTASTSDGISELDLLKLCKGLWYTLYMADKAVVQDELAKQISELLWCFVGTRDEDRYAGDCYWDLMGQEEEEELGSNGQNEDDDESDDNDDPDDGDDDPDVVMEELVNTFRAASSESDEESEDSQANEEDQVDDNHEEEGGHEEEGDAAQEDPRLVPHCRGAHLTSLFVRCLLRTVRREWHRMDKYRVDKFYTLLRYLVHQSFRYLCERDYHPGIVQLFNDAYFEEALRETPNGIRYHLMDVVVDELCTAVQDAEASAPPFTADDFLLVLEPYFALTQHGCGDDSVHCRAVDKVLLRFLNRYSVVRSASDAEKEAGPGGESSSPFFRQVHVGTVAQFIFSIASDPNTTKESYRKNLYDTYKAFSRRLKHGEDVDLTTIFQQETSDDSDVDIDGGVPANGKVADVAVRTVENVEVAGMKQQNPSLEKTSSERIDGKDHPGTDLSERTKKVKKKKKRLPGDFEHNPKQRVDDIETKETYVPPDLSQHRVLSDASKTIALLAGEAKQSKEGKRKRSETLQPASSSLPSHSAGSYRLIAEEELLITVQAQRAAREATKEAKSRKQKRDDRDFLDVGKISMKKKRGVETDGDGTPNAREEHRKRVKIGEHFNRARSYAASMKGLRSLESPARTSLTPERGILLNKDAKIVKKTPAHGWKRRRAVDYF